MRKLIVASFATALAGAAIAVPASAQTVTTFSVFAKPIRGSGNFNPSTKTFTFRNRLVQPGDRDDVIGSMKGRCRITKLSGHRPLGAHCRVVFFLPAGKVKVNGDVDFRRHLNKLPVVGGTRAYNGVGGKAIVHNIQRNRNLIDFVLVR